MKEAAARIKINKLLENAGWRFFADANGPASIQLEPSVALTKQALDDLGENFEKASKGFIDFLLLNEKSFPFIVLEAKAEDKSPLVGKEQARKYAKSQNCRFVILSNGNLHYFWDLERGNPYVITAFPTPTSVTGYQKTTPDRSRASTGRRQPRTAHPLRAKDPSHPRPHLGRAGCVTPAVEPYGNKAPQRPFGRAHDSGNRVGSRNGIKAFAPPYLCDLSS